MLTLRPEAATDVQSIARCTRLVWHTWVQISARPLISSDLRSPDDLSSPSVPISTRGVALATSYSYSEDELSSSAYAVGVNNHPYCILRNQLSGRHIHKARDSPLCVH